MNITCDDISNLVQEGKIKQLFPTTKFGGACFSNEIAEELIKNNVTEFANFAYTDYGALHGDGILDYAVIRFVEENYNNNDGCTIEGAAYCGKNMVIYGNCLKWFRNELMLRDDSFDELLENLDDIISDYEKEAAEKEADYIIKMNPDANFIKEALVWAILDADSGLNTNGIPDYSDEELKKFYELNLK